MWLAVSRHVENSLSRLRTKRRHARTGDADHRGEVRIQDQLPVPVLPIRLREHRRDDRRRSQGLTGPLRTASPVRPRPRRTRSNRGDRRTRPYSRRRRTRSYSRRRRTRPDHGRHRRITGIVLSVVFGIGVLALPAPRHRLIRTPHRIERRLLRRLAPRSPLDARRPKSFRRFPYARCRGRPRTRRSPFGRPKKSASSEPFTGFDVPPQLTSGTGARSDCGPAATLPCPPPLPPPLLPLPPPPLLPPRWPCATIRTCTVSVLSPSSTSTV